MAYQSIQDAHTAVGNSGVFDWDWGEDDADEMLERLGQWLYDTDREMGDDALRVFVRDELGDDPADYGL